MTAEVLAAFGRIDVLINSASIFVRKPFDEINERDWDANLDTNLKAPFFLAKFAGAAMRRNGRRQNHQSRRLGRHPPVQALPAVFEFRRRA